MTAFLHNLLQRLRYRLQNLNLGPSAPIRYVTSAPSPQNALDTFKGEWWSRLPEPFARLQAGHIAMFEDPRIAWALSQFGDVTGETILELGPLEGAHSYMFAQAGAASVIAIEANPRAYLKCLVVKEVLQLTRTHFLCGDFLEYLRDKPSQVFAVCASGVLYHMTEPVELLARLSKVTDRLFLWTHYYEPEIVRQNRTLSKRFTGEFEGEYCGYRCRVFRYQYWGSSGIRRFCGGSRPYAHWLQRDDILASLKHFGFNSVQIDFDTPDHPDGPAFALVAVRT